MCIFVGNFSVGRVLELVRIDEATVSYLHSVVDLLLIRYEHQRVAASEEAASSLLSTSSLKGYAQTHNCANLVLASK